MSKKIKLDQDRKGPLTDEEIAKAEERVGERCKELFEFNESLFEANLKKRKKFLGKLLTIIDASSISDTKTKATKDLIHNIMRELAEDDIAIEGVISNRISEALYGDEGITNCDMEYNMHGESMPVVKHEACDHYFPSLEKGEDQLK